MNKLLLFYENELTTNKILGKYNIKIDSVATLVFYIVYGVGYNIIAFYMKYNLLFVLVSMIIAILIISVSDKIRVGKLLEKYFNMKKEESDKEEKYNYKLAYHYIDKEKLVILKMYLLREGLYNKLDELISILEKDIVRNEIKYPRMDRIKKFLMWILPLILAPVASIFLKGLTTKNAIEILEMSALVIAALVAIMIIFWLIYNILISLTSNRHRDQKYRLYLIELLELLKLES